MDNIAVNVIGVRVYRVEKSRGSDNTFDKLPSLCGNNDCTADIGFVEKRGEGDDKDYKKKRKYKKKDTKESKLYLIRCYSNGEDFLKLGMTTKKVSERFKNNIPYKYEIIGVMPVEINIMLDYEQALHSLFKKYKYYPILEFSGYTECYTLEAKSEIIKFFK
mgnify:CR=1 FL=1